MSMMNETLLHVLDDREMACRRLERLVEKINGMQRDSLVQMLHQMHCPFKLDFTDEFLNSVSVERLRHIVLAASLHEHASRSKAAG